MSKILSLGCGCTLLVFMKVKKAFIHQYLDNLPTACLKGYYLLLLSGRVFTFSQHTSIRSIISTSLRHHLLNIFVYYNWEWNETEHNIFSHGPINYLSNYSSMSYTLVLKLGITLFKLFLVCSKFLYLCYIVFLYPMLMF